MGGGMGSSGARNLSCCRAFVDAEQNNKNARQAFREPPHDRPPPPDRPSDGCRRQHFRHHSRRRSAGPPAGDVLLDGRGLYRIDVGAPPEDGSYPPVAVTVFDGRAEAPSPRGLTPVGAGQAAVIYAGYDPMFDQAQATAIDDWAYDRE